ncbi:MAG: hypothetical protein VYA27_07665, partial [Verrucomicrobiota bacterium]|nr:hypothetical protein [Verrucomicrobiota bacterium]
MTLVLRALAILSSLALCNIALGQGSKADYERTSNLRTQARGKLLKEWVEARWHPDGTQFWYQNKLGDGQSEFVVVEAATGNRTVIPNGSRLLRALEESLEQEFKEDEPVLEAVLLTEGKTALLRARGKTFHYSPTTGQL